MAVAKILLLCLLVQAASATEGERPARTLGFLGFGSSSSTSNQPKVDPQPVSQVAQVPHHQQQQQQQQQPAAVRPFVYNVRYFSEPTHDRLKDRVLLYNAQPERVPCPLDHSVRVVGGQKDKVVVGSTPATYSYGHQPSVLLSAVTQQGTPSVPQQQQQQQPGNVVLPVVQHHHQPLVVPTVLPHPQPHLHHHHHHPQAHQNPGNVLLSVLQPMTHQQGPQQQPGVVLPYFSQTQQALSTQAAHLQQQQQQQHQLQHQQPQPSLIQQQQKVVPSFMLDYPYYYFYPEYVYVVPVLQQQQQQPQPHHHNHHHLLHNQQPSSSSAKLVTPEEVHVGQQTKQKQ